MPRALVTPERSCKYPASNLYDLEGLTRCGGIGVSFAQHSSAYKAHIRFIAALIHKTALNTLMIPGQAYMLLQMKPVIFFYFFCYYSIS